MELFVAKAAKERSLQEGSFKFVLYWMKYLTPGTVDHVKVIVELVRLIGWNTGGGPIPVGEPLIAKMAVSSDWCWVSAGMKKLMAEID